VRRGRCPGSPGNILKRALKCMSKSKGTMFRIIMLKSDIIYSKIFGKK
jgi:hypothetical protein